MGHSYVIGEQGRWNPIISVQSTIEVHGDSTITSLSRGLDKANVNKEILKSVLEKAQEELIQELCGRKYSRGEPRKTIRLWLSNELIAEMEKRRGEKSVDDVIDAMLRRELGLEPVAPGEGF